MTEREDFNKHVIERKLRHERQILLQRLEQVNQALDVIELHPELEPILDVLGVVI